MFAGFRVEGDVGGAGLDKVADDAVHRFHHQVNVDRGLDAVFPQCLAHHGADGQVGNIMIVHDVEMHDVGAGGEDIVDLLTQTGKIGGQNRRRNQIISHGAQVPSG